MSWLPGTARHRTGSRSSCRRPCSDHAVAVEAEIPEVQHEVGAVAATCSTTASQLASASAAVGARWESETTHTLTVSTRRRYREAAGS